MEPDFQHWTIRNKDWRYIRYNNGKEELYNHHEDPQEQTNLARKPEYKVMLDQMKDKLISRANFDLTRSIPAPLKKKQE